jgi:bifunctional oligoribonuclease and PAP phosphatase NrnA
VRLADPTALRHAIEDAVQQGRTVALLTHRNPDGDGFAACIALQEFFRQRSVSMDIVLEKMIPDTYDYLEGCRRSRVWDESLAYEVVIVLDCHERQRVGICAPLLDKARRVIVADHHEEVSAIENADVFIDPTRPCIGAVLFDAWEAEIEVLSFTPRTLILNALYTTVLNDTDNFANLNTDAAVFDLSARMCRAGLIPTIAVREFIFRKTVPEIAFLGEVLSHSEYHDNILFVTSTAEMLARYDLPEEATSGVTRWLKGVRGVRMLGYFREEEPGKWRASLRSDEIDVQRIAALFGGGGHIRAAGFGFRGPLEEVKARVLAETPEA